MNEPGPGAEQLAELFHATYERLAPEFGYTTRTDTRRFDRGTENGKLMIAVCDYVLTWLDLNVTADVVARLQGKIRAGCCTECGMPRHACEAIWRDQRKCCPDCTHGG